MFESKLILLVGIEMAVLLLLVCLLLFWHLRGLRQLVSALEGKIIALRDTLRGARADAADARQEAHETRLAQRSYLDLIEEQITLTRNHHLSLEPDRDIVLDVGAEVPLERQAMALRNAFLIAEQEAAQAAVESGEVDWSVLEAKLGRIIEFYTQRDAEAAAQAGGDSGEADETGAGNLQRRVDNLEQFRALYFDMEKRWQQTQAQLEGYRQQLQTLGSELGAGEEVGQLLEHYRQACQDFGSVLLDDSRRPSMPAPEPERPSVGRMVIANQEEIQRLRNMAVDQHKVIVRLKQQLQDAQSEEQKDEAIAELHKQLDRQQQFLQESDVCARQLESEIHRLFDENQALRDQLEEGGEPEQLARAEQLVGDLTGEGREMLAVIVALESENRGLQEQLQEIDGAPADALRDQLAAAQQRLLELQTQHIELEERYLELKAGG